MNIAHTLYSIKLQGYSKFKEYLCLTEENTNSVMMFCEVVCISLIDEHKFVVFCARYSLPYLKGHQGRLVDDVGVESSERTGDEGDVILDENPGIGERQRLSWTYAMANEFRLFI